MAEESSDDNHSIVSMKDSPKVIIIGAGMAGVAAGNYLATKGFQDFVILEATDRVGGRIWSVDLGKYPCPAHADQMHSSFYYTSYSQTLPCTPTANLLSFKYRVSS